MSDRRSLGVSEDASHLTVPATRCVLERGDTATVPDLRIRARG